MCISAPRKVVRVIGKTALMDDGRTVRLDMVKGVGRGDYLEVYGDIALTRLRKENGNEKGHSL